MQVFQLKLSYFIGGTRTKKTTPKTLHGSNPIIKGPLAISEEFQLEVFGMLDKPSEIR